MGGGLNSTKFTFCSSCYFNYIIEVQEMEQNLPRSCRIHFDDHNQLHSFTLTIGMSRESRQNLVKIFYLYINEGGGGL